MPKRSVAASGGSPAKRAHASSSSIRSVVALQREGHPAVAVNRSINSRNNLCWIPNGTRVNVLREQDGHFRVSFNGKEGWSKKYNFLENVAEPGNCVQILVSGCRDQSIAACVRGAYCAAGQNHGKPYYKKKSSPQQCIYFWDQRDGSQQSGWWLGPKLGGASAWSFHPNVGASQPPQNGWTVNGADDNTFAVFVQNGANAHAAPGEPTSGSSSSGRVSSHVDPSVAGDDDLQECVICCERLPRDQFEGKITQQCSHERDVCKKCVEHTIELEVNGKGNSTRVLCPHQGCNQVLDHSDVLREASKTVFERFDTLQLRQMLQAEPNFRWCAHRGCGNGQIVDDLRPGETGFNRFMRCHHCQGRTCAHHRCVWHTERTCQQYEADGRSSEEVALLQFFERDGVKRCPKCGHGIEKVSGCDHMTCAKSAGGCGAEFCMRCTADYNGPNGIRSKGNSAHKQSCPWYFPDPTGGS
eukprot:TRINITY_DN38848_c0_g1_i1.p1 TRINITY_DN38848_c0_g1~~TRINITY_DN38848_c0_g1_i1.p1  ORF type:complete len:470 (-),score=44.91 TRINITY_DN38848_c0_g1_i1:100-1509(-)